MGSTTQRRTNETIESYLPSSKYVEKFTRREGALDSDIKIVHLVVNLHGSYDNFDMIQELILDKGIPLNKVTKTSAIWRDNIGKVYRGESDGSGSYTLKVENFSHKNEKIELHARSSSYGSTTQIKNIISVIAEYTRAYEADTEQKRLALKA